MFKLFRKGNKPSTSDKVFIHTRDKWPYCQKRLTENPNTIFIGWFDDTIDELETYFLQTNVRATILRARTVSKLQIEKAHIIFLEHYPMKTREDQLLNQLNLKQAIFLTSADEPLLKNFGGEKLVKIMENMGMKDDPIEHKLLAQSIANTQKKIESKVLIDHSARSQASWMERNFK